MASEKSIAAFLGVVASIVSAFAFWGSAAFSPSVMLTFFTISLGMYCGVAGARKSAFVALYFGVAAWAPHVAPRGSTFDFGSGWLALFGAGLFFSFVLVCYQAFYVRAT